MRAFDIQLYLNRCHFPVRGLGFGRRTGIWLQGCGIGCPGCMVPETWHQRPEHAVRLKNLLTHLIPWLDQSDGVTISGGEPFEQPEGLFALALALRELISGDLLIYSGQPFSRLRRNFPDIVALADVIVSEPYVGAMREKEPTLVGSANQKVQMLTSLGRSRYRDWLQFPKIIGVAAASDGLNMAGIPRPGELSRLASKLNTERTGAALTYGGA